MDLSMKILATAAIAFFATGRACVCMADEYDTSSKLMHCATLLILMAMVAALAFLILAVWAF